MGPLLGAIWLALAPLASAEPAEDEAGAISSWEGPLPADRERDLGDGEQRGLWLTAGAQAAWLARDPHVGASLGIGFEHRLFALHLLAPGWVRVWDLPPVGDQVGARPLCPVVRCAEWVHANKPFGFLPSGPWHSFAPLAAFDPLTLGKLVEGVRVGRPGSWLHLRGGPLRATLGDGLVVDGFFNSPVWDQRAAGAFLSAGLPDGSVRADVLVGDVLMPHELSGARVAVRPFGLLGGFRDVWWRRLLDRFEVASEVSADLAAPTSSRVVGPLGQVAISRLTRPVVAGATSATWALLDPGGPLQLKPLVAVGTTWGLSPTGGAVPAFGAGGSVGVDLVVRVPWAAFSTSARGGLDSPGHRTALFGPLYELERRRAVAGTTTSGDPLLKVPAPGGVQGRLAAEVAVADVLRAGLAFHLDSAPGGNTGEAFVEAGAFGARGQLRLLRRGLGRSLLDGAWAFDDTAHLVDWDDKTWAVAEASVPLWGPMSAWARWVHGVRFLPSGVRTDDDVMVGITGALVVDSPWFDW